jgi:uracil-DNA glycosylase
MMLIIAHAVLIFQLKTIGCRTYVKKCSVCSDISHGIRAVEQFSADSTLLLVGQAPGRRVHETGIPFNDQSGERLTS